MTERKNFKDRKTEVNIERKKERKRYYKTKYRN